MAQGASFKRLVCLVLVSWNQRTKKKNWAEIGGEGEDRCDSERVGEEEFM